MLLMLSVIYVQHDLCSDLYNYLPSRLARKSSERFFFFSLLCLFTYIIHLGINECYRCTLGFGMYKSR